MADDIAAVGIKVQTDDVFRGIKSLEALASQGPKVEKSMQGVEASATKTGKSIASLGGAGTQAIRDVGKESASAADKVEKLSKSAGSAADSMSSLAKSGIAAYFGTQVVQGARSAAIAIYEASAAAERLRTMLNFASGGNAAQEIEYLRQVTGRLGLEFASTSRAYGQFQAAARGTALEGAKARDVFESIAKASAVMGLSTDQASGVLLALQQMISKGTVQAEELRGQLGERLPGAFQIAAKAMGVTTAELGKMLEAGQVIADDFLPKFAKALNDNLGNAADRAADRLDASVNKFNNAWERLKQSAGDSGATSFFADGLNNGAASLDAIAQSMERARLDGAGFVGQMLSAVGTMSQLTNVSERAKVNMYENAKAIREAEAELKRLQARGASTDESFWLRNEYFQLQKYIEQLKSAQAEKAKLTGADPRDQSGFTSRSQSFDNEAKRLEGVQSAMQKVLAGVSVVKESFYKDLNALYAGYQNGLIKLSDYQDAVKKLINEAGGGKASAAALKEINKELSEQSKLVAELAGLSGDFSEDWARLNLQYRAGKINLDQLTQAQAALLDKQPAIKAARSEELALLKSLQAQYEQTTEEVNAYYVAESKAREAGRLAVYEYAKAIDEQNAATQFELGLIGKTQQAREVAIAQYRIELDLKKQIEAIDKNAGFDEAQRIEERAKARAAAARAMAGAETRAYVDEWQRATDKINDSLTDALLRGFESGKDFAKNLRDTVVNMFQTMVLRPTIQAVVGGALGFSGPGAMASTGGSFGGPGNLVSMGQNLYSFLNGGMATSIGNGAAFGAEQLGQWLVNNTGGYMNSLGGSLMQNSGAIGNFAGSFGSAAVGFMGGRAVGQAISNGYAVGGGSGNTAVNVATAIGTVLGGPLGSIIGGTIGGLVNRAFGRKLKDSGLEGMFGGDTGFEGNTFEYYKGGWFRSSKTKRGELDQSTESALGDQFLLMRGQTTAMAEILGLGTDAIKNFSASIKISLKGLSEEDATKKIQEEFTKVGESLASLALGTTQYSKDGESASQTLTRLSVSLKGVNYVLDELGQTALATSLAGGDMADQLAGLFGGLDAFVQTAGSYYQNYYSEAERAAKTTEQVTKGLAEFGLALPESREAFRALVDAQDLTTESGRKAYAALLQLSPAFASIVGATQDLSAAAKQAAEEMAEAGRQMIERLTQERDGLMVDLLRAQGNTAGADALAREQALAVFTAGLSEADKAAVTALYDYNKAIEAQIAALDAAAEAQRAEAERVAEAQRAEAQRVAAIASERYGLETQLLQLQGDTAAIRARELAALDESNRSLLARIFALQDEQAAAAQAAQAQAQAAQEAEAAALKAAQALEAFNGKLSNLANIRFDLENQLLNLQGKGAEALIRSRDKELAELTKGLSAEEAARVIAAYDYNAALRKQIEETQAAQAAAIEAARAQEEAARAAEQLKNAWQSVTDSILGEVARIRGLIGGNSAASFAQAQAQFAITSAQARAGDQEAAKLLPSLSQSLLQMAEAQATSLFELQAIRAQTAASLDQTAAQLAAKFGLSLPRFDVGTNYVQQDMVAVVHEGEAIVPRAYNPSAGGAQAGGSNADLIAEIKALRQQVADLQAKAGSTADNTKRTKDILVEVTQDGRAMQTEAA